MVTILKIATFCIWLTIMIALIISSKNYKESTANEVKIHIDEDEDIEMSIKYALKNLKSEDRLVVETALPHWASKKTRVILKQILRKNPSIIFCYPESIIIN